MARRKVSEKQYKPENKVDNGEAKLVYHDPKYIIRPKNDEQKSLLETIHQNSITFVKGPPGCGKTLISVYYGINSLLKGKVSNMVLSRPAIEAAGERLGFLPGEMEDKISVYLYPLFDALMHNIPEDVLKQLYKRNAAGSKIRALPLAFMRGVTFNDSFVIIDEAQNTTPEQIRMLITRLGENSKIVICGDVEQSDIRALNGLQDAFELLRGLDGIGFVEMTDAAIVRNPMIAGIEKRYRERKMNK